MTTLQTVQKIIATELDVDPATLDPARPLQELGIDSLTVMECLFKIEDEFKISINIHRTFAVNDSHASVHPLNSSC